MAAAEKALARRRAGDFTLEWVLAVLVEKHAIAPSQAADVKAQESIAKSRIAKQSGDEKYRPTPIEVVALFQIPLGDHPEAILDQDRIVELVAESAGIRPHKIDPLKLDMNVAVRTVSRPFAVKHCVLPIDCGNVGQPLVVAVANPFDTELFDSLARLTATQVVPVLSTQTDIQKAIADVYGFKRTVAAAADEHSGPTIGASNFEQLVSLSNDQQLEASDRPVIQAVDYLMQHAFDNRASDIHIEPKREACLVRLRIDGVLHTVFRLPPQLHGPIVARIKTVSRLDISEKRKPQDGRIKVDRNSQEIEIRVSTLPTAFGEKAVLRIFDPEALVVDISALGFESDERSLFEAWLNEPHGLILVTGPTGSGKTTTLYSALKSVAGPDVNVTTIEDPIEMVWEPFNQVQVQPKIGVDFASTLRHILRQDPDIIMVGEIRDPETAENAIQAALTGHLVLSTLHTNDALGAIERMSDLSVPPFLISSCLLGVMAQRLLRKVCSSCAEPDVLNADQIMALDAPLPLLSGGPRFLKGAGCTNCRGTGFRGRTAVFEMVGMSSQLRAEIARQSTLAEMTSLARTAGFRTLRESAVRKLAAGVTSYDEVMRMTSANSAIAR